MNARGLIDLSIWLEFVWRVLLVVPVLVGIALVIGMRPIGELRVLDFLIVAILAAMAANAMTSLDTLLVGAIIAMIVLTVAYWGLVRYIVPSARFRLVAAYARRGELFGAERGDRKTQASTADKDATDQRRGDAPRRT